MSDFGLMLIVVAWFFQFIYIFQNNFEIKPVFTGTYIAGALLLAADNLATLQWKPALFNFIVLLLVLGIFWIMRKRQQYN